jgi:hypothetical protein
MKQKICAVFLVIYVLVIFAACGGLLEGGLLEPDDADVYVPVNSNEEGESNLIPDDGLMLYNMPGGIFDMDEGTFDTPETFGRSPAADEENTDPNEETRGKYIIKGPAVATSKLDSGGFTDVQFIHYALPLTGEFTLRARVRITAKAGDSSSKGFFFGAFTGDPVNKPGSDDLDYVKFTTQSKGAGILFRTNDTADSNSGGPAMRPYFVSDAGGWSTGPTATSTTGTARPEYWMNLRQSSWRQERIVEVVRQSETRLASDNTSRTVGFIFRVYDSKSEELLKEAYLDVDSVSPLVVVGESVYAGIALLGTSVELSQINLWDNKDKSGDPIFKTPDTKPAYVAVESLTITAKPSNSTAIIALEDHPTLPATSRTRNELILATYTGANRRSIILTPVFSPAYADNEYFDWKVVIPNVPDGITVEGIDGSEETGWRRGEVWLTKTGSAVIMATSRDPGLADYSIEIRVR